MKLLIVLFWLGVYASIGTWTAGAMNATSRAEWASWTSLCSGDPYYVRRESRSRFVFSMMTGIIPPGWIAALLLTGAYQDGWTMKTGPACNATGLL